MLIDDHFYWVEKRIKNIITRGLGKIPVEELMKYEGSFQDKHAKEKWKNWKGSKQQHC